MARKATPVGQNSVEPAQLRQPRELVRAKLLSRAEASGDLLNRQLSGSQSLKTLDADYDRWDSYNAEFLRRAFTSKEYADEYERYSGSMSVLMRARTPYEEFEDILERVANKRDRLVSIIERLDLIDEEPRIDSERSSPQLPRPGRGSANSDNRKVFLVHGQDEEAKAIVARFISSCDLEPIILHEQGNGGRTIIEKFEKEADVGFAVILMTPDDVGGRRKAGELASDDLQLRARQNVILELGYFAGSLGRDRVAALKKGDLEMPSDIAGVVWTTMDAADAWKMSLARELQAAGYSFDLGKALNIRVG